MNRIIIKSKEIEINLEVAFLDSSCARKIIQSLPIQSKAKTWGDEIYFDTGIAAPSQGATMDVAAGDIAYWPEGRCLCIFFGKTPASSNDKPAPASEVVIVGKASVEPQLLRRIKSGSMVRVE